MTDRKEAGKVITFYSYKGGTGRSMSLANVACLLAQRSGSKKAVLTVDWDLEAPGLHRYLKPDLKVDAASPHVGNRGLIELWAEIAKVVQRAEPDLSTSATGPIISEERVEGLLARLDLTPYVSSTQIDGVSILTAGAMDASYPTRISSLPWEALYHRCPFLFRIFAERLASEYEYVLIDSRTGVTDTSGICTMLLPEKLVLVFTPNRQSLTGVVELISNCTKYRRASDDLRPLVIFPLPSRIEASEPTLKDNWRLGNEKEHIEGYEPLFQEALRAAYDLPACDLAHYFDEIQIQHVPRYSYGEEIAVRIERGTDRLSLQRSYQAITRWLTSDKGPWEAVDVVQEAVQEKERELKGQYERELDTAKKAGRRSWIYALAGLALAVLGIVIAVTQILAKARIQANEASAVSSLLNIATAELSYEATHKGYACSLSALRRSAGSAAAGTTGGKSSSQGARLIDDALASGSKLGYRFSFLSCNPDGYLPGFVVTAVPESSASGKKSFCVSQQAVIRANPNGGDCTQSPPLGG
jgi:cellulose biosynthesis protein BcsQ